MISKKRLTEERRTKQSLDSPQTIEANKKEIYFFLFKIQADRKSLLKVASEMLKELKNPGENDIPSDLIPDMLLLAEYDEDLGKTPFQIA